MRQIYFFVDFLNLYYFLSDFRYQPLFNYCFTIAFWSAVIFFFFPPNSFSLSSCLKFSVHCGFKLCNNHNILWFISVEEAKRI